MRYSTSREYSDARGSSSLGKYGAPLRSPSLRYTFPTQNRLKLKTPNSSMYYTLPKGPPYMTNHTSTTNKELTEGFRSIESRLPVNSLNVSS
jgi:hypothetical protein